jgi:glutathione S-transferase
MQLYIGNKNYSTWSMRAWLTLKQFDIPFEEIKLSLNQQPDSPFKQRLRAITPTGLVPVLVHEELVVWDTLAIAETVAELFPQLALWPREQKARARARSLCAEMHSGFSALRNHCPMNIETIMPEIGAKLMKENEGVKSDLHRIIEMWQGALKESGGPFLFGNFSIADAFYTPVVMRIRGFALPVPDDLTAYCERITKLSSVQLWINDALQEREFIEIDEPYRTKPAD